MKTYDMRTYDAKTYDTMSAPERSEAYQTLTATYQAYKKQGLSLNMARGKPSPEQLELSMPLLDILNADSDCYSEDHIDCRNYGELKGIAEARKLFADYMEVTVDEIIVTGSASLTFMYDCLSRAMHTGVLGSDKPWKEYEQIKFLCPVPGYDRHFSICEFLGIKMIPIAMTKEGPDMDEVEKLTRSDSTIKGMWCVPKYSNPCGTTYSDQTIRRLASLKTAADDFRIFCDNAYAVHTVYHNRTVMNLLTACKEAGNPNRVYMFGSTNKITFPGAGVSFFAASRENVDFTAKQISHQAISWDKLNMLRHVRFLKDMENIHTHMAKHAELLRPRFDVVIDALSKELMPLGIGSFCKPDGGYFVTYQAPENCARRIVSLCKEAGMILTAAGATHPYGNDPEDCYIRIAPSYPSVDELKKAMDIFCVAAKLAFLETYKE